MSNFLQWGFWDANTRLITTTNPPTPTNYHNGLLYDQTSALVITFTDSPTFYAQGIGFTPSGAMCVVDASAGLPADVAWVNGLPISSAQSRLCVDPTGAVSYYHQGVTFALTGAVAITGSDTPPPVLQTFDTLIIQTTTNEAFAMTDNLRFGTAIGGGGYTQNQSTFMSLNPGLALQTYEGFTSDSGSITPPPSFSGFSVVGGAPPTTPLGPENVVLLGKSVVGSPTAILICNATGGTERPAELVFTFSPPISAVGLNLANSGAFPSSDLRFIVKDGSTVITDQAAVIAASWTGFTTFAGYASGGAAPTTNYRVTSDGDRRVTSDGDARIWV